MPQYTRLSALKILGLPKTASPQDIKKSYYSLSKKFHPDKSAGKLAVEINEATENFKKISIAYSFLKDNCINSENPVIFSGYSVVVLTRPERVIEQKTKNACEKYIFNLKKKQITLQKKITEIQERIQTLSVQKQKAKLSKKAYIASAIQKDEKDLKALKIEALELRDSIESLKNYQCLITKILLDFDIQREYVEILKYRCSIESNESKTNDQTNLYAESIVDISAACLCFFYLTPRDTEITPEQLKKTIQLLLLHMRKVYVESDADYSQSADPTGLNYLLSLILHMLMSSKTIEARLASQWLIQSILENKDTCDQLMVLNVSDFQIEKIKTCITTVGQLLGYNNIFFHQILAILPNFIQEKVQQIFQERIFQERIFQEQQAKHSLKNIFVRCCQALNSDGKKNNRANRFMDFIELSGDRLAEIFDQVLQKDIQRDTGILSSKQTENVAHVNEKTVVSYLCSELFFITDLLKGLYLHILKNPYKITDSNLAILMKNIHVLNQRQYIIIQTIFYIFCRVMPATYTRHADSLPMTPKKYFILFVENIVDKERNNLEHKAKRLGSGENQDRGEGMYSVTAINIAINTYGDVLNLLKQLDTPKDFFCTYSDKGVKQKSILSDQEIQLVGLLQAGVGCFNLHQWNAILNQDGESKFFIELVELYLHSLSFNPLQHEIGEKMSTRLFHLIDQQILLKKEMQTSTSLSQRVDELNYDVNNSKKQKSIQLFRLNYLLLKLENLYFEIENIKQAQTQSNYCDVLIWFVCMDDKSNFNYFVSCCDQAIGVINNELPLLFDSRELIRTWFPENELKNRYYASKVAIHPEHFTPEIWKTFLLYIQSCITIHNIDKKEVLIEKINEIKMPLVLKKQNHFMEQIESLLKYHDLFFMEKQIACDSVVELFRESKKDQRAIMEELKNLQGSLDQVQTLLLLEQPDRKTLQKTNESVNRLMQTITKQEEELNKIYLYSMEKINKSIWRCKCEIESFDIFRQRTRFDLAALQIHNANDWDNIPKKIQEKSDELFYQPQTKFKTGVVKTEVDCRFVFNCYIEQQKKLFQKNIKEFHLLRNFCYEQKFIIEHCKNRLKKITEIKESQDDYEKLREKVEEKNGKISKWITMYSEIFFDPCINDSDLTQCSVYLDRLSFFSERKNEIIHAFKGNKTRDFSLFFPEEDCIEVLIAQINNMRFLEIDHAYRNSTITELHVLKSRIIKHREEIQKQSEQISRIIDFSCKDLNIKIKKLFEIFTADEKDLLLIDFAQLDQQMLDFFQHYEILEKLIRGYEEIGLPMCHNQEEVNTAYNNLQLFSQYVDILKFRSSVASVPSRKNKRNFEEGAAVIPSLECKSPELRADAFHEKVSSPVTTTAPLETGEMSESDSPDGTGTQTDSLENLFRTVKSLLDKEQHSFNLFCELKNIKKEIDDQVINDQVKDRTLQTQLLSSVMKRIEECEKMMYETKNEKTALSNQSIRLLLSLLQKNAAIDIENLNGALHFLDESQQRPLQILIAVSEENNVCLVQIQTEDDARFAFNIFPYDVLPKELRESLSCIARQGFLQTDQPAALLMNALRRRLSELVTTSHQEQQATGENNGDYITALTGLAVSASQVMCEVIKCLAWNDNIKKMNASEITQFEILCKQRHDLHEHLCLQCATLQKKISSFEEKYYCMDDSDKCKMHKHLDRMKISSTLFLLQSIIMMLGQPQEAFFPDAHDSVQTLSPPCFSAACSPAGFWCVPPGDVTACGSSSNCEYTACI